MKSFFFKGLKSKVLTQPTFFNHASSCHRISSILLLSLDFQKQQKMQMNVHNNNQQNLGHAEALTLK